MEDVMKLLKGKSDSERMAGMLIVTKLCDNNDHKAVLDAYNAIGPSFLNRLLVTGIGQGDDHGTGLLDGNREAFLELAMSVLAAFSRVPEIAASDEMLSKVPLVLKAISNESIPAIVGDCCEFLFLVSTAHKDGVATLYESALTRAVVIQMPALKIGSHEMDLAIKLVILMVSKLPGEGAYADHAYELLEMVSTIAKQFALLQNAMKFDALHLLSAILSSKFLGGRHEVLKSKVSSDWLTYARIGVMDILQNRVAPAQKLEALIIAESIISIFGEAWLVEKTMLIESPSSFPTDRCILLVLESSRVEIAVILNELAYFAYEVSCPNSESFLVNLRSLGVVFSLVERVINFISKYAGDQDSIVTDSISESTLTKIILGLDETISVVLDYLLDAKVHGNRKGDDLLACVRIVGSYLGEAPHACKEKVRELIGFMLTVEGHDESSNLHCISFLLPMMCQMTMENDGYKIFYSSGAFVAVVGYLVFLVASGDSMADNANSIFLACDTILNVLLKREHDHFSLGDSSYIKLLEVLPRWADNTEEPSFFMMASSICSLILERTSEIALLQHNFKMNALTLLSKLMKRSLFTLCQDPGSNSVADLCEIVNLGYLCWAPRFPHIKQMVEGSNSFLVRA